jgi:hypothetical protein
MSKLQNIKTIQKMLDGTSRWQTRTTVGFSDVDSVKEKNKEREDGEIWEEKTGEHSSVWWRLENGIKVKYSVHPTMADEFRDVRLGLKKFWNCPKETCTCTAPKPIDEKLRKKTGMCEDCLISFETKLKIQGKFNQYAVEKMKNNALSFFKQADEDVEQIKSELGQGISFVNEQGDVEKWGTEGKTNLLERIDSEYNKFKESVLSQIESKSTKE